MRSIWHATRPGAPHPVESGRPRCRESARCPRPGRARRGTAGGHADVAQEVVVVRSSCTKACQVAGGVDRVVEGMTSVAVKIHQAANTETGTRRRRATDQRRGRRPTSPTGNRPAAGTGVATGGSGAPPGAGASGPSVTAPGCVAWRVTRSLPPCPPSC